MHTIILLYYNNGYKFYCFISNALKSVGDIRITFFLTYQSKHTSKDA